MTRQRRKIIAVIVLIVEILALILVISGLYTRLAGAGNPVGSVYIWVGCFLAYGGAFAILSVSQKRRPVPKEETTASERDTEKQDGGLSDDQETENPPSFL
jgi:hypothetical protein